MWNTVKTTLLLGALTGLVVVIGGWLGGTTGLIIAFVFAVAMNMGAWWFSDSIALRMSGAQEVSPAEAPELHRMVAELAQRANLPKPRVAIIDSPVPNAFATGRSPERGVVAATTGIMQMLTYDELAGVMAHELAHIKNRDTLISSVSATIAGIITFVADMAMWSMIFGMFTGGNDEEEGGGLGELFGGILLIILAPIAATIIQLAISRTREYGADAEGARILGNPLPLASALEKLELASQRMVMHVNPSTAHQYIVNPLHGGVAGLFSTHPNTQERISRLRAMAGRTVTA
ncbi:MAG: zinc metalloprotease HtpX [Chloroflexaceae bacterium]|nr:zinc metalloprotease HtpX [Chloroflexaceae bacterium]